MTPLIQQLTFSFHNWLIRPSPVYLLAIKPVPSPQGLTMDLLEVSCQCSHRVRLRSKSLQFWMVPISLRLAKEYTLRKKCFTPESNNSLFIQVSRMQGPNPHLLSHFLGGLTACGSAGAGRAQSTRPPVYLQLNQFLQSPQIATSTPEQSGGLTGFILPSWWIQATPPMSENFPLPTKPSFLLWRAS
jgi:hypothetical protein